MWSIVGRRAVLRQSRPAGGSRKRMLIGDNSTRAAWLLRARARRRSRRRARSWGRPRDGRAYADRLVMVLARGGEGSGFCTGVRGGAS